MWSYIMDLGDNSSVDAFASVKMYRRLVLVRQFFCELAFVR